LLLRSFFTRYFNVYHHTRTVFAIKVVNFLMIFLKLDIKYMIFLLINVLGFFLCYEFFHKLFTIYYEFFKCRKTSNQFIYKIYLSFFIKFHVCVVLGILSIFSFFIFSVSVPFLVLVMLLILALLVLLLLKNNAELNQFSGVLIVVALEMNIYNNPGHNSSINFFPGLTTIYRIGWFGPTFCP
jgi:hypothetical protein